MLAIALLQYPQKHRWLDKGFMLSALFAILVSFSGAHGLLVWLAVFPLVWVRSQASTHPNLQRVLWLLLFVGSVVLYATGYQAPANNPDRTYVLQHPNEAIPFFLAILGRPFATEPGTVSWVGAIVLLACILSLWLFWQHRDKRHELAAWLPLLIFPLGFAAMTTVGRTVLGIHGALVSRYTTVTVLILIGLIHIGRSLGQRQPWRLFYGAMAVVFAVFSISKSFEALESGQNLYEGRRLGQQCLALIEYMEPSPSNCLLNLYPNTEIVQEIWYPQLEQLGFFEFIRDVEFSQISETSYGVIDEPPPGEVIPLTPESVLRISGWSVFPGRPETPEIVLLSQDDRPSFFAASLVNQESPDLAQVFDRPEYDQARWQIDVPGTAFPEGITSIRAWIYDDQRRFIPLDNPIQVTR
ncbi:MAG: hypothetical protein EA395_15880 [Phormidium sp. GEM2.Bin31]|nr:MAG: hypothetical protein EA395_15880 [Phormidium sp. GEM2.Bin31]